MNDRLSQRLQDWQPRTDFDPGFSAKVQSRLRGSAVLVYSPVFRYAAVAGLIGAMAIGVSEGLQTNRTETSEQFAAHYARSIDPLLLADSHTAHSHR